MPTPYFRVGHRRQNYLEWKTVEEHVDHVGKITFAWTQLHSRLYLIFLALLDWDDKLAKGLWHCILSDSYQRDLLMAVARAKLDVPRKRHILKALAWVVDRTGKLAQHRNDITHTGILPAQSFEGQEIVPDNIAGKQASAERLFEAYSSGLWAKVVGDLNALFGFASLIAIKVVDHPRGREASLRKPQLQSIPTAAGRASPRSRSRRKQAPKPRR